MLNGLRVQVKGSNLILLREFVAFLILILDICQSERNDPSSLEDWHLTYLTFSFTSKTKTTLKGNPGSLYPMKTKTRTKTQ
jgi:hypothetical protein